MSNYGKTIAATVQMVRDRKSVALVESHKLQILNLTWEDTGRFKGSAVGPNISDMSIQVQDSGSLHCMPVIRYPNFSDVTGDVSPDYFGLLVGNEKGAPLRRVTLRDYLGSLRRHLTRPESWGGAGQSLLCDRDSHVLVSAQACFLPIPKKGAAEFNPVLFNYQSIKSDPAVLAVLATREGTSATVIDNVRDAFQEGRAWGQRLFFNQSGERASLTGTRLSDFEAQTGTSISESKPGLNLVLLIQVPLKTKERPRSLYETAMCMPAGGAADVEDAVIGHGKVEGPFTEIDGLSIERDPRFPIRVTVQFYKATSNGIVSRDDIAPIAEQIDRVYKDADYVGSLVAEGESGRPTEHAGPKTEPPEWWDAFWARHERNTGQKRGDAIRRLRERFGPDWVPSSEDELRNTLN